MQIIIVSNRLARAHTLELTKKKLALLTAAAAFAVLLMATGLYYITFRHAAEIKLPLLQNILAAVHRDEAQKNEDYMRENLNAMAVKLGQMQAQLMRLDALGERLSALSGIKPQEFRFNEKPGQGGPLTTMAPSSNLEPQDLNKSLDQLSQKLENRNDYLAALENHFLDKRIKAKMMPTMPPVDVGYNASGFGWRIDPFNGTQAMHEGIDFIADTGTPILAAAGGIVIFAEYHPSYGNLVEIDHGNGLTTRYAHASKIEVKVGDVIKRGKRIAAVGSTGRSTGPHCHFEVRLNGVAQNPARFLLAAKK